MRRYAIFAGLGLALALACAAGGTIIYVDDDANAPGDGKSWATAYRYLQDALADAKAADKPVEIQIGQGIYKPNQMTGQAGGSAWFKLTSGVALMGAYAGISASGQIDPNVRDIPLYETILSGDLAGNDVEVDEARDLEKEPTRAENTAVLQIYQADNVLLDGITIASGRVISPVETRGGTGGGAIVIADSSPTINNCTFRGNTAEQTGGAVFIRGGHPTFTNCMFLKNYAGGSGGAIAGGGQGVTITNCTFSGNGAYAGGAIAGCQGAISNCVFQGNSAEGEGGALAGCNGVTANCVFIENSAGTNGGVVDAGYWDTPTLKNCVFQNNKATGMGGVLFIYYDTQATLINCSFSANSAKNGNAIASYSWHTDDPASSTRFTNCILWDGGQEIWKNDTSVISVTYSDVFGGYSGVGNIDGDPLFADPNNGNFHLKSQGGRWDPKSQSWVQDDVTSPCIDAGDPNSPIGLEPFPNGGRINMGAYGGTAEASKSYFGRTLCIYVDDDAPAGGDGKSWATAYRYLQDALADANTAAKPPEIWVGQGVYKADQGAGQKAGDRNASFQLVNGVAVRGGYAGFGALDPNARDIVRFETILSGDLLGNDVNMVGLEYPPGDPSRVDNSLHILQSTDVNDGTVIEGFTIANGNNNIGCPEPVSASAGMEVPDYRPVPCPIDAGMGAGMWNTRGSPRVVRCTFGDNSSLGAVMFNVSCNGGRVESCIFRDNFGCAISNDDCTAWITESTFQRNTRGGVDAYNCAEVTIERCLIRDNSSGVSSFSSGLTCIGSAFIHNVTEYGGGAISGSLGAVLLKQCLFADNSAQFGGGAIGLSDSILTVLNCTFAKNDAPMGEGGAIRTDCVNCCDDTIVRNGIFWGNTAPVGPEISCIGEARFFVDYSDVQGQQNGIHDPCQVVVWGKGNIGDDPLFVDPQGGDFHLRSEAGHWDPNSQSWIIDDATSPCIDAGDPNDAVGLEPFPNGGRINMGTDGGTSEASKSYFIEPLGQITIGREINGAKRRNR